MTAAMPAPHQPRRVNAEAEALIKRWEGLRLQAYPCAAGVWTIGYGHTRDVRAGDVITQAQADACLRADLRMFEAAVDAAVQVDLNDGQFGALVSFAFNVGVAAFRRSSLLRRLNAGDYDAVPVELARWNRAAGRVLPGLVNRRAAEAGLWARGGFVASSYVAAAPSRAPVSAGTGAVGGVLGAGTVAMIAEQAGAVTPALAVLRDLPAVVALAVLASALVVALLVWKPWRRA